MNYTRTRAALLAKPEAIVDYPFGPDTAVFKVYGKMFATLAEKADMASTNLKCNPDEALALRDIFPAVQPGYHMNKKHWNTVILDGSVPEGEILRMIDMSYALVVSGMPRASRQSLELKHGSAVLYMDICN